MEKERVLRLLSLIEAEYPQSFKGLSEDSRRLKVELWQKEFEHDDETAVFAAVRMLMRDGREFAPTSGQIREKMLSFSSMNVLDEHDAWNLVAKACSNGFYGYKKEFDKLPPEVQRAVGRPEQLKEWSVVDSDTFQTVIASNFMRSYRMAQARERELARIPQEVRAMLTGVADRMMLNGTN